MKGPSNLGQVNQMDSKPAEHKSEMLKIQGKPKNSQAMTIHHVIRAALHAVCYMPRIPQSSKAINNNNQPLKIKLKL